MEMSKETEAIKAVALVAEQAYREVFHVDETSTTAELHLMVEAIAVLDKPTYLPLKFTKASRIGYQINGVPFPPDPTSRPEASQPDASPATVEKLVEQIRTIPNPWSGDVDLFQNIRLATRQGFEECREAVLKLVRSQGLAQPVTAEKLAKFLTDKWDFEDDAAEAAESILKAFPTLGSGRLTRDDPRVQAIINKWRASDYNSYNIIQMVGDLLSIQGQAKVSKEQWEKLVPTVDDWLRPEQVKAWLKAELGVEVKEVAE